MSENIIDTTDRATADKLLMAKLFRELRHVGVEAEIQGMDVKVHNNRAFISGQAASQSVREKAVRTLGSFAGVTGVEDQMTLLAATAQVTPTAQPPVAGKPDPFANPASATARQAQNMTSEGGPVPAAAPAPVIAPAAKAGGVANPSKGSATSGQPKKKVGPAPVYHTVGEGTTLWAVSEKYLGDGNRYMEIFEANRGILKNPDQLEVGQKLRIPQK